MSMNPLNEERYGSQILAQAVIDALTALKQLVPHVTSNLRDLAVLEERIKDVRDDVHRLSRIVYDGNGQPSLLQQASSNRDSIRALEQSLEKTEEETRKHRDKSDTELKQQMEKSIQSVKQYLEKFEVTSSARMDQIDTDIEDIRSEDVDYKKVRLQSLTAVVTAMIALAGMLILGFFRRGGP
jgi:predicted  nucleic acid-binding Zn-ribbon protein